MNRTLAKMIPTVTLLIFTEQLKEEKAMDVKDYAIAIASVMRLAKANGIDPDDLDKKLGEVLGIA